MVGKGAVWQRVGVGGGGMSRHAMRRWVSMRFEARLPSPALFGQGSARYAPNRKSPDSNLGWALC